MLNAFFDTYQEAKSYAESIFRKQEFISNIRINKNRNTGLWEVRYSIPCDDFINKHIKKER